MILKAHHHASQALTSWGTSREHMAGGQASRDAGAACNFAKTERRFHAPLVAPQATAREHCSLAVAAYVVKFYALTHLDTENVLLLLVFRWATKDNGKIRGLTRLDPCPRVRIDTKKAGVAAPARFGTRHEPGGSAVLIYECKCTHTKTLRSTAPFFAERRMTYGELRPLWPL
jgi:hypothetical protein